MTTLVLLCPSCAQAVSPPLLKLVGLFLLTPFAVAAVVVLAVMRASARQPDGHE